LKNLIGTLHQEGQPCLTDLNVMLFEITSPQTGHIYHSGLFNLPKEQSLNPDAFTLLLSDNRNADILIKSSALSGEKRAVFFSVIGGFYYPLPPPKLNTSPLASQ
jgi:hypothetical protein